MKYSVWHYLAMAMIPGISGYSYSFFLSMGAWRLAKKNSFCASCRVWKALGAVSVLCVDKTGTITMNQMTVQDVLGRAGDEKSPDYCHNGHGQ